MILRKHPWLTVILGAIWMKPNKVMCNIAELLIKYTEERTIMKPFIFYLVFDFPLPCFECLVHIVLFPKGQDSTMFTLGPPTVPHKVSDSKQLSVDVYSLGWSFIIPPRRHIYMLTEAYKDLTGRINGEIPGICSSLVGSVFGASQPPSSHLVRAAF